MSASAITEEVLLSVAPLDESLSALPTVKNIARAANAKRRKTRPREPTDLAFALDQNLLPPRFLQADLQVDGARHIIFATPAMLHLLGRAKRWYVDGTFKVVRRPFQQLLSVHAFVKRRGTMKHVPLCFVLMSQRRKRDYRAVFNEIKRLVPDNRLREVMSDFESALWRTFRHVFGADIVHRGCVFHWTQAVWRKIQRYMLPRLI